MAVYKFIIPGKPMAKGRPRFTRAGRTYTPEQTANYETLVKLEYQRQVGRLSFTADRPLAANIAAFFPVPKSASKKKKQQMFTGVVIPTTKPDLDNISKIILDSLNGLAYRDDSQIVILNVIKRYCESAEDLGRVEVILTEVE